MRTVLLVAAIVLGVIATILGFGWITTDSDPHVLGWLAASLVCFYGAHLVND